MINKNYPENVGKKTYFLYVFGIMELHSEYSRAHLIMSDSGSVRGEAPSLGITVLVLRDTIEHPKGGGGKLKFAGTNKRPF